MDKTKLLDKLTQIASAKFELDESIQLIEIVNESFHEELNELETKISGDITQEQMTRLQKEMLNLYSQYEKTLKVIEEYIDDTYKKTSIN